MSKPSCESVTRWTLLVITVCVANDAYAAPAFTDVTMQSGVQALRDAKPSDWWLSGLTFIDLDRDGVLDLYLADHQGSALAAINDGSGHFALATGMYPTSEIHLCLDTDEDGQVDLDATFQDGGAKWWFNHTPKAASALQFTDAGDGDTRGGNESRSEALVDLNGDGKLDWVRGCQGQNFKVDFGDGHGNFAADSALIAQPQGNALDAGMIFADLDGDGDEDMIINWGGYSSPGGDDYGRVRILINEGNMNLVEKTTELGLATDHVAILGAGDVDQDGDVDLIGLDDRKFPEAIYLNDGHGTFSELSGAVSGVSGSAEYALWGLATVTDLDNDGVADILIDGRVFFHVLHGEGGGHFAYQNDAWGGITHTAEASVDSGFAFGDIDNDGDLDLIAFTSGDPNRQVALYRNDLPPQHWLNVRPKGSPGNLAGVGSKIRIYEAGSDHLLWYEEVLAFSKQAQQNYYAFDALERHYGLGARDTVDLTVTFPSGTTVRKNGAAAGSIVVIGEDGTNGVIVPPSANTGTGGTGSPPGGSGGASAGGASGSAGASRAGTGGASRQASGGAMHSSSGGSSATGTGGRSATAAGGASAAGTGGGSHPSQIHSGCGCHIVAAMHVRDRGVGSAFGFAFGVGLMARLRSRARRSNSARSSAGNKPTRLVPGA